MVLNRGVLVAQVLLDDVLHVFGQVGQALLNVLRLRPGPASDQLLVVVGQVHKGGSVLPQADGVNEGEAQFAGREGGEQAEEEGLDAGSAGRSAVV